MIDVVIQNVEIGAQHEDIIYDFWIKCETNSGKLINVFDSEPIDLRNLVNNKVSCSIDLFMTSLDHFEGSQKLHGKFIEKKEIDQFIQLLFETSDGIFILEDPEEKELNYPMNEDIDLYVSRLDLRSIQNIN
jgi:hypothetical protein